LPTLDLSDDEISRISRRTQHAFDRSSLLTWPALVYVLAETGPRIARADPRQIRRAFAELSNMPRNRTGDHGPWEPIDGIYVAPNVTRTNTEWNAKTLAAGKSDRLRRISTSFGLGATVSLARSVADALGGELDPDSSAEIPDFVCAGITLPGGSAVVQIDQSKGDPVRILVFNSLEWLYPDDPPLWRFLLESHRTGFRSIVLARKAPIAIFPLMKKLGALLFQLHHMYYPLQEAIDHTESEGWPPARLPNSFVGHAITEMLKASVLGMPPAPSGIDNLFRIAREKRLDVDEPVTAEGLLAWRQKAKLPMHGLWINQLRRWSVWSQYSRT
jgi:hypothetical protein